MKIVALILAIISLPSQMYSVEIEKFNPDESDPQFAIVVLTAALQGGSPGSEFSQNYAGLTLSPYNTYETNPYYQAAIKFTISDDYRIAVLAGYSTINSINNISDVDAELKPILGQDLYLTTLDYSGIPLGGQIEYLPFNSQFRTFVAVGGGAEIGNYKWQHTDLVEQVERNQNNATINQTMISPFIRLNAGTELGFDKDWKNGFFAGLSADISVTRYFRNVEAFKDIEPFFYQSYSEEAIAFFPWQVNFGLSLIINATN